MEKILDMQELELTLGEHIRSLRLQKNLTREEVCSQAGVSVSALRHLETGEGATVKTLLKILRALDREKWIDTLRPQITINPLHAVRNKGTRERARKRKRPV